MVAFWKGIKEAANLWSFWGSDIPKIIRALSLGPGVIWRPLIYNLKFVIKTDSSRGVFFLLFANFRVLFFTPRKRDYKASAFFLLVLRCGIWRLFFIWKTIMGPLGGNRKACVVDFRAKFWLGKNMEKNQQINTSSIEELGCFFARPRWCSRTHILSIFLVNLGKNIPTPWILSGTW